MKCQIKGCRNETNFDYHWEQNDEKRELWLCKYCEAQLLGEMLKQVAIERMIKER